MTSRAEMTSSAPSEAMVTSSIARGPAGAFALAAAATVSSREGSPVSSTSRHAANRSLLVNPVKTSPIRRPSNCPRSTRTRRQ